MKAFHRNFISTLFAALLSTVPITSWGQYFFDSQISSGEDIYTTKTFSLIGAVKSVHRKDVVFREHCTQALPYIIFNLEGIQHQYRDLTFSREGLLASREGVACTYLERGTSSHPTPLYTGGYSESRSYNSKGELSSRRAIIFDTDEESTLFTEVSIIDSTRSNRTVHIRYTRKTAYSEDFKDAGHPDFREIKDVEPNEFVIIRDEAGRIRSITANGKSLYCLEYNTGYRHNSHIYASWNNSSYNTTVTFSWNNENCLTHKSYWRCGKEGKKLLFDIDMQYDNNASLPNKIILRGGWGTPDGRDWAWVDPQNEDNWPKFEFNYIYDEHGNIHSVDVTYIPDKRVKAGYFTGNCAFDNGGEFWDTRALKSVEKHLIKYEYEYDRYGNWRSQKLFANGELIRVISRSISYWE